MKIKKYFLPLMLTVLFLFGCATKPNKDNTDKNQSEKIAEIKKVLAEFKEEHGLSAILFGVWEGDHEILTGALGSSTKNIPAQTQMNYRSGGVTETMLTTILLKLIEEKKYGVTLDDSLAKWFPKFPHSKQVTLRMLGNSTSGYYDFLHSEKVLNDKELFQKNWNPMTLVEIGVFHPILFEPGSKFDYSHTNFCILGLVLEKITHKSLPHLVNEYISKPLNLKNTQYTTSAKLPSPALHSYVTTDGVFNDATDWTPTWAGPSGLVISNLSDIGKWMIVFGSGKLISPESYQQLTKVALPDNPELGFALGVIASNSWLYQNPSINGYKTIAAYFKPKNLSLVITTTDGIKSDPDKHYAKLIFPRIAHILAPEHPMVATPQ